MNFLLNGYYGYGNAGDEAVLASLLEAISRTSPGASFTVTSGDPAGTVARYNTADTPVAAIPRQAPGELSAAIKGCDVFISGGGSLLQDVTSLRNIVYYTTLMRFAQACGKPVMVYAQGIGPLARPISQKLTKAAVNRAAAVTVRDSASKALLQKIGVTSEISVTADPVWALSPQKVEMPPEPNPDNLKTWAISLRPWTGYEYDPALSPQIANDLRQAVESSGARFRFVPMQDSSDRPIMQHLAEAGRDAVLDTSGLHPREIMSLCGQADVMIAMRLHALIFAAAQGVPCVAINYDPKVAALAKIIGAPLLENLSPGECAKLPEAVAAARAMDRADLMALKNSAGRNAELAAALAQARS